MNNLSSSIFSSQYIIKENKQVVDSNIAGEVCNRNSINATGVYDKEPRMLGVSNKNPNVTRVNLEPNNIA